MLKVWGVGLCVSVFTLGCRGAELPAAATRGSPDSVDASVMSGAQDAVGCAVDASPADAAPQPPGPGTGADAGLAPGTCAPPPTWSARLVAPISGSTVTSSRPRLRLAPVAGSATHLQICADRGCAQVIWETTTDASELTPTADLPPGYWFWRVEAPAAKYPAWSAPWLFRVRRRAPGYAPIANTAAEPFADYNGDGYPDVVVYTTRISIYLGGPDGISAERVVIPEGSADSGGMPGAPGSDLNGDGYTDFATVHLLLNEQNRDESPDVGLVQFGQQGGLSQIAASVTIFSGGNVLPIDAPIGIGDVDGDGFGDLLWPVRYGGFIFRGCATAPAPAAWGGVGCENCQPISAVSGDLDGDGRWDVIYSDAIISTLYRGGPTPPEGSIVAGAFGGGLMLDANYDGYSDLLTHFAHDWSTVRLLPGGPDGLAASPVGDPLSVAPAAVGDFDGDGLWDAITLDAGCQEPCFPTYTTTVHYGAPGPWGAAFAREATLPLSGNLQVTDVNADGYDDLLVASGTDGSLQLWRGSPTGLTAPASP